MVSQKFFGTQPPTLVPANMSGYRYTGLEVGTASAIEFIDKPGLHTCTFNKLSITNFCVTTCINREEESTCTCRSSLHMSHFSHVKVYPQFIHTLYNIHVLTKAFSGSHSSSEILSPFCSAACFWAKASTRLSFRTCYMLTLKNNTTRVIISSVVSPIPPHIYQNYSELDSDN